MQSSAPETQRFCGWGLVARNPRQCQGCTNPVDTAVCDQFFDDTFYLQPTGGAPEGFVIEDVQQNCTSTSPGTSNCGSCPASGFTSDVFTPYTNCGQPQTCGNSSYWGCVSGLVDVNGICQKSVAYQNACPAGYDSLACECNCVDPPVEPQACDSGTSWSVCKGCCVDSGGNCPNSPIVIDIDGNGFTLTNAEYGVDFDLDSNGIREHLSWTSPGSDDAWLALDRNGNGIIDNGGELFGNFTAQPEPQLGEEKNGFLALAEYDKLFNGGNSDGFINRRDDIFDSLRLWQDVNHNGVSEASELHTLPQLGLRKLHLDYRESRRTDEHGNRFKYRARVKDLEDAQLGRWAWDVFLVKQP